MGMETRNLQSTMLLPGIGLPLAASWLTLEAWDVHSTALHGASSRMMSLFEWTKRGIVLSANNLLYINM
jgi:hypothetical protein